LLISISMGFWVEVFASACVTISTTGCLGNNAILHTSCCGHDPGILVPTSNYGPCKNWSGLDNEVLLHLIMTTRGGHARVLIRVTSSKGEAAPVKEG